MRYLSETNDTESDTEDNAVATVKNCDQEGCEAQKKAFSWYVDVHDENGMEIQTKFDYVDSISTSSWGQDMLGMRIEKYDIFVSKDSGVPMDESGLPKSDCVDLQTQMCKLMPPIIQDEDTVENIETASDAMKSSMQVVTILNILGAIFLGGVL